MRLLPSLGKSAAATVVFFLVAELALQATLARPEFAFVAYVPLP
jgi:hypothetical protein